MKASFVRAPRSKRPLMVRASTSPWPTRAKISQRGSGTWQATSRFKTTDPFPQKLRSPKRSQQRSRNAASSSSALSSSTPGCRPAASSMTTAPTASAAGRSRLKRKSPPGKEGIPFRFSLTRQRLLRRRNRVRVDIRNRRRLLFLQLRMRERLARHHRLALAGVVEEDCLEHRALLQIERMQAIVGVHVGVVYPGVVVHRVLDVLEARQTDCVERQVVGAPCVPVGDGANAEVRKRS